MHWIDAVNESKQGLAIRTERVYKRQTRTYITNRYGICVTHSVNNPHTELKVQIPEGFLDWLPAECLGEEERTRADAQCFSVVCGLIDY
jgi:hypothetical protein